ncbi:MAG: single-stranded DNA-binding protein [Casimicrobiaceae bacterium]
MFSIDDALLDAARTLSRAVARLRFPAPVAYVYNPLDYAFASYAQYVHRFGATRKQVVLVGMNPGPFGMVQTGVPFGEVAAVRDWMGIHAEIGSPASVHPKRPVEGFACTRSEVSGKRLWGWAAERFGNANTFFADWFVVNYCPLAFVEPSGRNFTPDHLPAPLQREVYTLCDRHLAVVLDALAPTWAIGIGAFAEKRISAVLENTPGKSGKAAAVKAVHRRSSHARRVATRAIRVGRILHPSPASPIANRGWAGAVERELAALGVPAQSSARQCP